MTETGDMLLLTKASEWHNPGCLLFVHEIVEDENGGPFSSGGKVKCTYFVECLSCGKGDRQYVRDIRKGEHTRNFECIMDYEELSTRPRWEPLFPDAVDETDDFLFECIDSLQRMRAIVSSFVESLE